MGIPGVLLFLLAFGSDAMLNRESIAVGGVPETLLSGPLLMFLTIWLAHSRQPKKTVRFYLQRLIAYFCWGLVTGFGLWSHMLVAPFILMSGLLLLIFCWRELLRGVFIVVMLALLSPRP